MARRGNGKECAGEQRGDAGRSEGGGAGAACGSLVHNGTSYGGMRVSRLAVLMNRFCSCFCGSWSGGKFLPQNICFEFPRLAYKWSRGIY